MGFKSISIEEYVSELGSKAPVPGGGGTSALACAVGIALGDMAASLTIGKPKYQEYQDDLKELVVKTESLEQEFLDLIQKDADVFEPLSKAYKIGPGEQMEHALKLACEVPLEIMRKCAQAIDIHDELSTKVSKLTVSDVGAGVVLCKAAMQAASLNVYINTSSMEDKKYAEIAKKEAKSLLSQYLTLADKVFERVQERL